MGDTSKEKDKDVKDVEEKVVDEPKDKQVDKKTPVVEVIDFKEVQSALADTTATYEEKINKLQKYIDDANKQHDKDVTTLAETLEKVSRVTSDMLATQQEQAERITAERQTDYTIEDAKDVIGDKFKEAGFGEKRYKDIVVTAYEDLMTRKVVENTWKGTTHLYDEEITNAVKKVRWYNDLVVLQAVKAKGASYVDDATEKMVIDTDWLEKKCQYWPKYKQAIEQYQKAQSLTTSYGGDWVPTGMSSEVTDLIELQPYLPSFFPVITMPTSPYRIPRKTSRGTVYFVGENTANEGVKHPASEMGTGYTEFVAKKFAERVLFSDEIAQDSLPNMYNYVVSDMAPNFARNRENVIINGDSTSTGHMDSDVTNPNDARKSMDGFRQICEDGSDQTDVGDYMTAVKILTIRNSMGKYASGNCALVIPVTCLNYLLILQDDSTNKNRLTVTADAGGPFFTIWNGIPFESQNRSLLGMKLIVSEHIREDTDSAVYGSGQTKTMFFIVNQEGFAIGSRKLFTLESERDIDVGQTKVVAMDRWHFKKMHPTAIPVAWQGYDVTSGVA